MYQMNSHTEADEILYVIEQYDIALSLLDAYDHQTLDKPKGNRATHQLAYSECKALIAQMRFSKEGTLFGNEKDDSFKGSIGAIYQTFGGEDLYPSLEEKAANLLYFVTKNHSFSDGNKRIAAALFLYFLDKNEALFFDGNKRIADHTLVALTILIAESRSEDKDMIIRLIMKFLLSQ
ncbi:MAG: type II toxin-antitoxin system death-on-curing family toxin [Oscillospiraceae bacterium]|jgi:death-on-curing protein